MMSEPSELETRTHLVAHCLREVESAVRHVLGAVAEATSQADAKAKHRAKIAAILVALELGEDDPVSKAWLALADSEYEHALARLAHRDSLRGPRRIDLEFTHFWERILSVLDAVTARMEERFVSWFPALDELAQKGGPTTDDASFLRQRIPNNNVTLSHFFDQLTNPAWLTPLREEGFFAKPPDAIRDAEKGTVGFPSWPEGRYLARMAASEEAAAEAVDIILEVEESENERAQYELLEGLVAAPAELSVRTVPVVNTWLERPGFFLLPERAGEFIQRLAHGGHAEAAAELARALLSVRHRDRGSGLGERVEARFDLWHYERVVEEHLPALWESAPSVSARLAIDLLIEALELESHDGDSEDGSYVWYRAIEDDIDRPPYDVKQLLVLAARRALEALAAAQPSEIQEFVVQLRRHSWPVCHRLAFHIVRLHRAEHPELVREILLTRELLADTSTWHEYALLLRDHFGSLDSADREQILGWIEEGPELDEERRARLAALEIASTEEELAEHQAHWRFRRLSLIAVDLPPGTWQQEYEALQQRFEQLDDPSHQIGETESWVGPTSPKKPEDLKSLSVAELVDFLRTWEPPKDDWRAPSPEGLGRALADIVKGDPERFAAEASAFQGLDPTYVRSVLSGLRQALKDGKRFDWSEVLAVSAWILQQPRSVEREARVGDRDPGWGWTRGAVADLLGAGLEESPGEIPFEERDVIWSILLELSADPEPTPEYEAQYGGDNMDPATLALNTVRGEAMHAVVRYALWIRRRDRREQDDEAIRQGFDRMPEVRELLDEHLDPAREPSLAIRSVYGRWFPWLCMLDEGWASSSVSRIFPVDEPYLPLRDAAWETYLRFSRPYSAVFNTLRLEYDRAVAGLDPSRQDDVGPTDAESSLAQHLMAFYLWGRLTLEELQPFFERASDQVRAEAIDFLGRTAREAADLGDEHLERLTNLWESRAEATATDPSASRRELSAFGWWFSSSKFDADWALSQLLTVLDRVGVIDVDHLVAERLQELAADRPLEVLQALRLLIEGDLEGWRVIGLRDEVRTILRDALASTNPGAAQAARDLVNVLVARGYPENRELINHD